MIFSFRRLAALAALASTPLAGCAYAHEAPTAGYSEILSELPADAPPGECYAKVATRGETVAAPPAAQGAVWVISQTPAGPVYCLVPTGPTVQPVAETVTRYGWIRVLCDQDATPERISRVQTRLHDRGYYRGQASGRYDRATVDAVSQFQAGAHLDHGGYLSLETLDALEAGEAYDRAPAYASAAAASSYSYSSSSSSAGGYGYAPGAVYAQPVYAPPIYAPPCNCGPIYGQPPQQPYYPQSYPPVPQFYAPQAYAQPSYAPPCCMAAQTYGYSQGAGGGYGFGGPVPAYAAASAQAYAGGAYVSAHASARVVQNGWLMWGGKSGY